MYYAYLKSHRSLSANDKSAIVSLYGPPVPKNLRITNASQAGQHPELTWDASPNAASYKLYRCLDDPTISTDCQSTSSYTLIRTTTGRYHIDYDVYLRGSCYGPGTQYYKAAKYHVEAVASSGVASRPSSYVGTCTDTPAGRSASPTLAEAQNLLPEDFSLEQNYPNPFNPSTEIRFALPEAVHVRLAVYDVVGREVTRLMDQPMEAGYHRATFNASDLPSGVYLYRVEAGSFNKTGRMVLMK